VSAGEREREREKERSRLEECEAEHRRVLEMALVEK